MWTSDKWCSAVTADLPTPQSEQVPPSTTSGETSSYPPRKDWRRGFLCLERNNGAGLNSRKAFLHTLALAFNRVALAGAYDRGEIWIRMTESWSAVYRR